MADKKLTHAKSPGRPKKTQRVTESELSRSQKSKARGALARVRKNKDYAKIIKDAYEVARIKPDGNTPEERGAVDDLPVPKEEDFPPTKSPGHFAPIMAERPPRPQSLRKREHGNAPDMSITKPEKIGRKGKPKKVAKPKADPLKKISEKAASSLTPEQAQKAQQELKARAPAPKAPAKREKYGLEWAPGTKELDIELWCYRENHPEEKGGLGAEGHFRNAFKLMWPHFKMHKWMDMLIMAFCNHKFITVIGHTRASKTYGMSYILYLDWLSDPSRTWTSVTTVTFDGLRSRMWSDIMAAVESASYPANGLKVSSTANLMEIKVQGDSKASDRYRIEGFATSRTKDSAGRIQGKHAGRRRLILDEAQELPDAIYQAEVNASSSPDFKSVRLANPVDKTSRFGMECEPKDGWESVTPDTLMWLNRAGHIVLHFDGLQSYNYELSQEVSKEEYKAKKYSFMIDAEYIEDVRLRMGEDSLEWWMYVRGFFPPDGLVARVFTESLIEKMKVDLEFIGPTTPFLVKDPAFEADDSVMHWGEYGQLKEGGVGLQFLGTEVLKYTRGVNAEPKDYQAAEQVTSYGKAKGVQPENAILDASGNARGLHAILRNSWGNEVKGVQFSGKPTERKLNEGDSVMCVDRYCYFVDELWFRTAEWARSGRIGGLRNLDPLTERDLASRIYEMLRGKLRLETKENMKKRLGRSPDYGDALCLGPELMARKWIFPTTAVLPGTTVKKPWRRAMERAKRSGSIYREENMYSDGA